jgi:hypothetical protein
VAYGTFNSQNNTTCFPFLSTQRRFFFEAEIEALSPPPPQTRFVRNQLFFSVDDIPAS